MRLTREFYIPKEARIHHEAEGLVIYRCERDGQLFGMAFIGKQSKPFYSYRFRNEEERARREQLTIEHVQAQVEAKALRRKQRAEFQHSLKEGDILHASWGWEQTNNDFYQVIKVSGKSVVVRQIASQYEETGFMSGNIKPLPNRFRTDAEPMTRRVTLGNGIKLNSYKYASKCDPSKSFYESNYA